MRDAIQDRDVTSCRKLIALQGLPLQATMPRYARALISNWMTHT
jgi:hypothetical protein